MSFDPFEVFASSFTLSGKIWLDACPVCKCPEIAEIWKLPQNRLKEIAYLDAPGSANHRTYIAYLPTLETPQEIYKFDICKNCESVFLNPKTDDQNYYKSDTSKVKRFREHGVDEFRGTVSAYEKMMPAATKVVLDAACGAGQALQILRETMPNAELIGLELSEPSVAFMNDELKIRAHAVDLDLDDLSAVVASGTVDFIIFSEAYEHVRYPLDTMHKLVAMLRPGGVIHFTAQYYGDNPLQIRVGEPIYINQRGMDFTIEDLGLELIDVTRDIKIRATARKPV